MATYSVSFFLKNPEKLNYFNASELENFTKKKSPWEKDPVREQFIKSYCKSDNRTIKNAIAGSLGYNDFTELKDQHKDIQEKTIELINAVDIPDISSTIIKFGGYHTNSYKNTELIETILDKYAELRKLYKLIEDYLDWIALRKNSILQNENFRKLVKGYCLIRLSGGIGASLYPAKLRPNISIIRENLTHFNLINLPDLQEDSPNSINNKLHNIDFHHVVEPANNKYLKIRLETILFMKNNTGIPVVEHNRINDKNFCKIINHSCPI